MVSKKVRELFGPPANLTFAPPNPEMVKAAILMLHAQVKAAREKEAAKAAKRKEKEALLPTAAAKSLRPN